ncbi:competence protein [Mesorhizobium australicum]|uniref:competence protein n=1 Tax=Mesorhizobium australicum TaxID=536018 RepID=UPI00111C3304|nr:competence protein [Mesorhizobium australicum]
MCDSWHEPRTQWHYAWQDRFPKPWQEFIRYAPSGEKHIADVHTGHGFTIEFQYSYLKLEERLAREAFHGNLAWVVSGGRLTRDLPRFLEGLASFQPVWQEGVYVTPFPERAFPRNWLDCSAPVFFDFANAPKLSDASSLVAQPLWCLLPKRVFGKAVVLRIPRNTLVRWAHERDQLLPTQTIMTQVARALVMIERARQAEIVRLRSIEIGRQQRRVWRPRTKRRRFRRY